MWQSIPTSISANSNHIFRQIQHNTSQVQNTPQSASKNSSKSPDAKQAARSSAVANDDVAQIWIDQVKRRRILMALLINCIVQSLLVVLVNIRPTFYFWRAFTLSNFVYLAVYLLLQQIYLVLFIRHVKVVTKSRMGWQRIFSLMSNPSTLGCAILTMISSLWTLTSQPTSISTSLHCYSSRMILFSMICFIRRLITQRSFRFPILQLPLDTQIRSKFLPIISSSLRYCLVFTVFWYLAPIRLISFILQRTPLSPFVSLFSSSDECHFHFGSELTCILMCLKLFISWELSRHILEVVLMQSILSDKSTTISISVLVKVLQQDRDLYTRSLGFLELSDVCNISTEARATIYRSGDNVWSSVLKICTHHLDTFSKSLYAASDLGNKSKARSQLDLLFAQTDDLINITQALSGLVVHSIEEDEMGLVQRSFEEIVGSLLAASIAIEDYTKAAFDNVELSEADKQGLYIDKPSRQQPCLEAVALSRALDRALYRIIFRFYRYLKNFSFPQEYALRLRQYAEFQH